MRVSVQGVFTFARSAKDIVLNCLNVLRFDGANGAIEFVGEAISALSVVR